MSNNSGDEYARLPRQIATPGQVDAAMRAMTEPPTAVPDPAATARAAYIEERIRTVLAPHRIPLEPTRAIVSDRLVQELRVEFETLATDGHLPPR